MPNPNANLVTIPGNLVTTNAISTSSITATQVNSNLYCDINGVPIVINNNYGNANVANYMPLYGGQGVFSNVTGTLDTAIQNNITQVGTLDHLEVTNKITGLGNLELANSILVNTGGITLLDPVLGNVITNANVVARNEIFSGRNIDAVGNVRGNIIIANTVAELTIVRSDNYQFANGQPFAGGGTGNGNYSNANVASYLPIYTGNIQAGNVNTLGPKGNISGARYVSADYFIGDGGNLQLTTANTHIIPALGNVYSLGNATNPWQSLYVSGNTIYLANVPLSTGATGNTLYVSNVAVVSLGITNDGNIGFTGEVTANLFVGNIAGSNVVGEVAVANVVSNPLQPVITQVGTLTALTTGALDVTGQLTSNANAQFNGNVYFAGNVDIAGNINQISGNSGQFFGNAQTGFEALYAGVPAGYDLLQQEVTQFATNYNGYAQVNARNINGGDQATTDYVATADNGTDTTNYINMGIAGSGYNGLLANNSLGNSLFATDGYLYTQGNVTGGNLVLGTSQANGIVRVITGASDLANVRATFTDAGLSVNGNITGNYLLGNGSQLTGLPATYSNVDVFNYLGSNSNVVIVTTGNITGNYISGDGSLLTNVAAVSSETIQFTVKNTSGGTLTKGTPIYAIGTVGATDVLEVTASRADTSATMPTIGLLEQDLSDNAVGVAISIGALTGTDTSLWATGDELYVAATGGLTNVRPTDGLVAQTVGSVGRVNLNTGTIITNIYDVYELPNLNTGNIWIGAGNLPVQTNLATYTGNIGAGNLTANFLYGNGAGITGIVAAAGALIANGTSNVSIPVTNGNILFNVNGVSAGYLANNGAVALGPLAGQAPIGANAVAIGYHAGGDSQSAGGVAVGALAGNATQGLQSVAVGFAAGQTTQGAQSVAVGFNAGAISQGTTSVAIGPNAGGTSQGNTAIAIGQLAGSTGQNVGGIAIGSTAARSNQGTRAIAIGDSAAYSGAGVGALAMGYQSAYFGSGSGAIAIGYQSAAVGGTQGVQSIAIGQSAAGTSQGNTAVAIGVAAGSVSQGANAVAIGAQAGANAQGINSVAIGRFAGQTTQVANSIILNGSGLALNASNSGFYVAPVRQDTANVANVVYFNTTTKELTYGPITYGNANVSNLMASFGSNNISTTGNIAASYFTGNGALLTGVTGSYNNANVATFLAAFGSNSISTLGNVSSGNVVAGSITTAYTEITTAEADGINLILTFTTQANVPYAVGSKVVITGLNSTFAGTDGTYVVAAATTSTIEVASNYPTTAPTTPLGLSTIRAILNSVVSATGNIITDGYFKGDGSLLTGIPAGYSNADVSTYLVSGDDTQGFITSGNVNATAFNGDGQGLTNVNALTLGNALPNVSATANTVVVRNANASVIANTFIGSGATLANINAANITGLYGNIDVASGSNINFAEGAKLYSIPTGGLAGTTEINGADNRGISVTAGGNVPGSSYAQIQWVDDINDYDPFGYANAITNWVYVQNDGIYFETIDAFNTPGYYHSMVLDTDGLLTVPTGITGNGNIDIGTNYFIGNGSQLTGLPATYGNANVADYLPTYTGNVSAGNVITSNIVGTSADPLTLFANDGSKGNIHLNAGNVRVGKNNQTANLSTHGTSNLIISTNEGSATEGNIALLNGANANININPNGTGVVNISKQLSVAGNVTTANLTVLGSAVITGNANIQGTLTYNDTTNITTSNLVLGLGNTQTGINVTGGGLVIGNTNEASWLYNFATQSWNSNIGISAVGNVTSSNVVTGNITAGNVSVTGNITAAYLTGNGAFLTGLPAGYANSNVFSYLANSNVVMSTTGNITGNYIFGNGSQLTGISSSSIFNGTSNVNIATANSAILFAVGGTNAGNLSTDTVSFGTGSGGGGQLANAVAIGTSAGAVNQQLGAIAIGANAAPSSQGNAAIAIGQNSGGLNQGPNSIAIGANARSANSAIVLNATGSLMTGASAGFYVNPIRNLSANLITANVTTTLGNIAVYDTTAKEVVYSNSIAISGNIKSGNLSTVGSLSVTGNTVIGGNISAANLGNVSPLNLNNSPTQTLYGDGVWKDPISGTTLEITKFAGGAAYGTNFFIAGGRLFAIAGTNNNNTAGLGQFNPTSMNGIPLTYEIIFPNETVGTLVDAGHYGFSAYALFSSGNLYTWGNNGAGQLGLGNTTTTLVPTLSNTSVAQVYTHASQNAGPNMDLVRLVIRKTNNTFWGVGYNAQGQFGNGTTTSTVSTWTQLVNIPVDVLSVWNIGNYLGWMVIQKADGSIWVAGANWQGQLGVGSYTQQNTFVAALGWLGGDYTMRIQTITAGGRYDTGGGAQDYYNMTMFLDNGTTSLLLSCGSNNWGLYGNGNTTSLTVPVAPSAATGLSGRISKITTTGPSPSTIYVLMTNGNLFSWGWNTYGAVGNGTTTQANLPYALLTGNCADIINDQMGWQYYGYYSPGAIVKKTDGSHWCCGYNAHGQVGVNNASGTITTLQQMPFPKGTVIKFTGTCNGLSDGINKYAVTADNQIWAWGYNGQYNIVKGSSGGQANNLWAPVGFTIPALIV